MSVFKCEDCGEEKSANAYGQCARCLRDLCEDCMGDGECPNEGVSHVSMSGRAKVGRAKVYKVTVNAMMPVSAKLEIEADDPMDAVLKATCLLEADLDAGVWYSETGELISGPSDASTLVVDPDVEVIEEGRDDVA